MAAGVVEKVQSQQFKVERWPLRCHPDGRARRARSGGISVAPWQLTGGEPTTLLVPQGCAEAEPDWVRDGFEDPHLGREGALRRGAGYRTRRTRREAALQKHGHLDHHQRTQILQEAQLTTAHSSSSTCTSSPTSRTG
jgi:hypothetical protein